MVIALCEADKVERTKINPSVSLSTFISYLNSMGTIASLSIQIVIRPPPASFSEWVNFDAT